MTILIPFVIFLAVCIVFVAVNYFRGEAGNDCEFEELKFSAPKEKTKVREMYEIIKQYIFPIISCTASILSIINFFRLNGIC